MRADNDGELKAFAFVLEQDLSRVQFEEEFAVSAEWAEYMIRITDLQDLLVGFTLDAAIRNADQYGEQGGEELAVSAEIARR